MKHWFTKKEIPLVEPLEGYNQWAHTYTEESNPIKALSNQLVEQLLPDLENKSVLDAGCGTGYFCVLAQKKGAEKIVGVDFSPAMLDIAKANCPVGDFFCSDISTFKLSSQHYDVIICALVLGHIEHDLPVLTNLANMLRGNGELILTDFHPYQTQHQAKRTFRHPVSAEIIEIKHYLHQLKGIEKSLEDNGLTILTREEPEWNSKPVIYGLKAKKLS